MTQPQQRLPWLGGTKVTGAVEAGLCCAHEAVLGATGLGDEFVSLYSSCIAGHLPRHPHTWHTHCTGTRERGGEG